MFQLHPPPLERGSLRNSVCLSIRDEGGVRQEKFEKIIWAKGLVKVKYCRRPDFLFMCFHNFDPIFTSFRERCCNECYHTISHISLSAVFIFISEPIQYSLCVETPICIHISLYISLNFHIEIHIHFEPHIMEHYFKLLIKYLIITEINVNVRVERNIRRDFRRKGA